MRMKIVQWLGLLLLGLAVSASAAPLGADRHGAKRVPCSACHGEGSEQRATPTIKQCSTCHAVAPLVAKTAALKPHNPHTSPHYGAELECTNCHVQHGPTEDFCAQCHSFGFKVP